MLGQGHERKTGKLEDKENDGGRGRCGKYNMKTVKDLDQASPGGVWLRSCAFYTAALVGNPWSGIALGGRSCGYPCLRKSIGVTVLAT